MPTWYPCRIGGVCLITGAPRRRLPPRRSRTHQHRPRPSNPRHPPRRRRRLLPRWFPRWRSTPLPQHRQLPRRGITRPRLRPRTCPRPRRRGLQRRRVSRPLRRSRRRVCRQSWRLHRWAPWTSPAALPGKCWTWRVGQKGWRRRALSRRCTVETGARSVHSQKLFDLDVRGRTRGTR